MSRSTLAMVAFVAITLFSLAAIQSAEARYRPYYRSVCGYPDSGYLAPYPFGGNSTPRVKFVAVVLTCPAHPFVVWKHCSVDNCR